jgi:hypothetical protein
MGNNNNKDTNQNAPQKPTSVPKTTHEINSKNAKETNHREPPVPPKQEE